MTTSSLTRSRIGALASLLLAGVSGCWNVDTVDASTGGGNGGSDGGASTSAPCGAVTTIASGAAVAAGPIALQGDTIYYVMQTTVFIDSVTMMKVPLAGGAPSVLNQGGPMNTSLNALFIVDTMNLYSLGDGVWTLPVGGGTWSPYSYWTWASSYAPMVMDAANLYWFQDNPNFGLPPMGLVAMPLGATDPAPTTIAPGSGVALVLDEDAFYWSDGANVMRTPKSGGPATMLASGHSVPILALDAANVYYFDVGDPVALDGGTDPLVSTITLMKVPKAGGPASALLSGQSRASPLLATDGSNVYWSEQHLNGVVAVWRVPVAGGARALVASVVGLELLGGLIACPAGVCWSQVDDSGTGSVMRYVACP